MSRLYWSNFPEAKRPRGGTRTLCSSFTREDLPTPEYPETSTSSGTRFDDAIEGCEQRLDLAVPPVSFSGIRNRSDVSSSPSGKSSMRPLPFGEAAPQVAFHAGRGLVALFGGLGEQLHDDCGDGPGRVDPLAGRHG